MDLLNLQARITMDSSAYESGVKNAESGFSNFSSNVIKGAQKIISVTAKAATAMTAAFSAAAIGLTKSAVSAYGDYEQLVGGVETLFKDSADIVQRYADEAYKTAGMSANEYMTTVTGFSASLIQSLNGDTRKAAKLANVAISDMSDNANKMGTDMEAIRNAYAGFSKQNYTMLDNLKLGYGGTKSEMDRLIKDAMRLDKSFQANTKTVTKNGKAVQELDYNYADVVNAIHIVQDNIGITGTTMREAADTIQGSIASTRAAWGNLMVAFGRGSGIKEAVGQLTENAKNVIKNIIPVAKNALEGIGTFVQELAPIVVQELPNLVRDILPSFISAVGSLFKSLISVIPSLLNAVGSVVENQLIPMLGSLLADLLGMTDEQKETFLRNLRVAYYRIKIGINDAIETVQNAWENHIKPVIIAVWTYCTDTLWPALQGVWEGKIKPTIETVMGAIVGFWEDTLKPALVDFWTYCTETLWPTIQTVWETQIQPTIETVINAIAGFWNDTLKPAWQEMSTFVTETLWPAIQTAWETNIRPTIETAITAIAGFWNDTLKPAWEGITTFITDTLVPKVTEGWDSIKSKIDEVFKALTDWWNGENGLKTAWQGLIDFITTDIIPNLDTIGPVVEGVVAGIVALKAALSFGSIVHTLVIHLASAKSSFGALFAFVQAHPFALIVSAIAGVITMLISLYNHNDEFKAKVDAAWEKIKEVAGDVWGNVKEVLQDLWDNVLVPLGEFISGVFSSAWDALSVFFTETLPAAITVIRTSFEMFKNDVLIPVKDFLVDKFTAAWTDLKDYWENELSPRLTKLGTAFNNFKRTVLTPIATFLKNTFSNAWTTITNLFSGSVTESVDGIGSKFSKLWNTYLKPIANWLNSAFKIAWGGIKTQLNNILDFITNVFSGNWSGAWDALVSYVTTPFETIGNILKTPINAVIDLLNGMINSVKGALNTVVDFINETLSIKVPSVWFDPNPWSSTFGVNTDYKHPAFSWSPNISGISWPDNPIPKLARGGILSRGSAIIGEAGPELLQNINGRSVVTPLSGDRARAVGATFNATFNITAQQGQDVEALAHEIERVMTRWATQKAVAFV